MIRWVATACRLVTGGTFAWAAATKVTDLPRFATEIANYQLVPAAVVPWFAATLGGVELLAGALCLVGFRTRGAAAVCAGMLVVFIGALSLALMRGINLQCGCFGGADLATWGTVGRDVALLVPATILLWTGPGRLAIEPAPVRRFF